MKNPAPKNRNITAKEFINVILFTIIIYFIFVFFYLFASSLPIVGNKISKSITQKNIELLYLGMSEDELVDILYEPFKKYKKGLHYFVYVYSKAGIGAGQIEIYMYIKNDKLDGILMEYCDRGFYKCSTKKCPKILDQQMYDSNIPIN